MSLNNSKLPKTGLPRGFSPKHEIHPRFRDAHADPDGDRLPAPDYDIPLDAGRDSLTQDEMLELANCEVTIQRGLKTFYEVGEALMVIREKRLYRQSYDTFAEYCQARWDMTARHANRLVGAAEVIENLRPIGLIPQTESQARPLTELKTPSEQQAAAKLAVEIAPNGKPTAVHYQKAVDAIKPRMTPPGPHPGSAFPQYAGMPAVTEPPVKRVPVADEYVPDEGDSFQPDVPEEEIEVVQIESDDEVIRVGGEVWLKSGQMGTVKGINGRLITVETQNGTRVYDRANMHPVVGEGDELPAEETPAPSSFAVGQEVLYDTGIYDGNRKLPPIKATITGFATKQTKIRFFDDDYNGYIERHVNPQKLSALPAAEVKQLIIDEHYEQKAAEREARRLEMAARREAALSTPLPTGKYRCLVIDPPWPVQKIERDVRPNQDEHLDYPTMSLEDIQALPIGDLADEGGCHLYLWTTQKFLPDALRMVEAWGFEYQCVMPWVKPTGMTPYSWMYNVEFVIFARRGGLPLLQNGLKLSIEAPSEGHSIKPDAFYQKVMLASPEPRLDMFARREREGFRVWGDEVAHES